MRVPQDLREWFDTPEIKRPLHTKVHSIVKGISVFLWCQLSMRYPMGYAYNENVK